MPTPLRESLQHLKILSILYYVVAGLTALGGCVPFIHLSAGLMIVSQPGQFSGGKAGPPPALLGWFFVGIATFLIVLFWAMAMGFFLAGRFLTQKRRYVFCLIVAGLAALQVPHGTVLGVFTFIVLMRPEVKELFESGEALGIPGSSATPPASPGIPPSSIAIQPDHY